MNIHVGLQWKIHDRRQITNTDDKKLNTNPEKANNAKKQQNKTTLVQLLLRTLGQETTWAYSTMLSSPHGV